MPADDSFQFHHVGIATRDLDAAIRAYESLGYGVIDAGVVMATDANLALLDSNGLLPEATAAVPEAKTIGIWPGK